MNYLDELEAQSIYVMREAYAQFRRIAILWSIGKDSTTLLWMARKAFFDRLPFPVVHIDTSYKFKEIYEFRDRIAREWRLDLRIARNERALEEGMGPNIGKLECCSALKTDALKSALDRHGFRAILLGIRRDEHGIRAKERYFSPRDRDFSWDYGNQPAELWDQYQSRVASEDHIRVHPMLHWTEQDVWEYVERESMPVVGLYFAKDGRRYRSIGCECCCAAVPSSAETLPGIVEELRTTTTSERAGRAQDKESAYIMQKLRSLGYM